MRMTRRLTAKFRDDRMEIQTFARAHPPPPSIPKVCLPMDGRHVVYRYYFNVFIDGSCRVEYVLFEDGDKIDGGGIIFEG